MAAMDAPIVGVTVYPDRARVTRRGNVQLEPGDHVLVIGGLPATLEPDSVRAGGRGAGVRLLGVEVATAYVPQAPEANLAELQQQVESLQDRDRALADAEAAEAARQAFLDTLRENGGPHLARAIAKGSATIPTVEGLAAYLAREVAAMQARRRDLAGQRRSLAREIAAAQRRLAAVQPAPSIERREIRVAVEVTAATSLQLEVLYAVRNASWTPLYDLRLAERQMDVTYLAHVQQQSGEDWPAVPLALSTARPAVSATIPELDPWYLDIYHPPPPRHPMPPPAAAMQAAGGYAQPARARDERLEMDYVEEAPAVAVAEAAVESRGAAVTYRVARPVAVPADGAPHRTTVTTFALGVTLDYVTVPKLAEEAYLRATVKNTSPYAFLPGQAAIFHGDDFVGTTALELVAPNEEFKVQLGVDDRVKITRELTGRATSKTLVGNTRRTQYVYKITLANNLAIPAPVLVYDQLPVARNEEIKIKLQEITPPPVEQNGLGILQWALDIPAGEKREIVFSFTVEHPRNLMLTGLAQ